MSKLYEVNTSPKERIKRKKANHWTRGGYKGERQRRFYSSLDISIIKHDEAVKNAQMKRGEIANKGGYHYISECGCGAVGCFIHGQTQKI